MDLEVERVWESFSVLTRIFLCLLPKNPNHIKKGISQTKVKHIKTQGAAKQMRNEVRRGENCRLSSFQSGWFLL